LNKVTRRDAIKAFAGAGIVLAASPALLNVAAAKPEVSNTSGITSDKLPQVSLNPLPRGSGSESVVIHLRNGKLVGYKGTRQFVFSDAELVARISEKFGEQAE
jgi:hypothetical protein